MAAAAGVRRHNWQLRLSPEELELMEAVRAADPVTAPWSVDSRADWLVRLVAAEGERLLANGASGATRSRVTAAIEAVDRHQSADRWARGGRPPYVRSPRGRDVGSDQPTPGGDA
jgi:hypothetical protein